jgi:hypothetical protein
MQKFQIMSKKNNPLDDYQKLRNEVIIDRVNQIFRKHPDKYIQKMEEAGFVYYEEEDLEKIDEDNAFPENKRQEYLIAYFAPMATLKSPTRGRVKIPHPGDRTKLI